MKKNLLLKSVVLLSLFPLFYACKDPVIEKPFITNFILKNQTNSEIKIVEFYSEKKTKTIRIQSKNEFDTTFIGKKPEKLFKGDSMYIYKDNILTYSYSHRNQRYCRHNLYKLGTYKIKGHKEKKISYEFDFNGDTTLNFNKKEL